MPGLRDNRLVKAVDRVFGGKIGILEATILSLILAIAFFVRVLPLRWGLYLSEFDPWMQYKEMMFIVERGWSGFIEFFSWHDIESWYPYGRNVGKTAFPGLPFLAAFIYHVLHGIGISVDPLELAAFLPPVFGVVATVAAFLLGRELGGKPAGFMAAFFMALSNASIGRTHLGWFDDESISIPLMLLGIWGYMMAIKEERSWKGTILYSIFAGVSVGYVAATWGAAKFPLAFIPIISVILALIGRYRRRLLVSYLITMIPYTSIAVMVPKLGPKFLTELTMTISYAVFIILLSFEAVSKLPEEKKNLRRLPYYVVAAGAIGLTALSMLGAVVKLPGHKFSSVLIPTLRANLPIVISVAENQISTWATLFSDSGYELLLIPVGIYYVLKRREDKDIVLAVFTLFSIYFASTMVRLTVLAAPAIAVMAGYGLTEIFKGLARHIRLTYVEKGRKRPIGIEFYILTPLLISGLLIFNLVPAAYGARFTVSSIDSGYVPPTIVSSSVPFRSAIPAWLNALTWMRDNLPPDAIVASWWDYGYWITILGNHTSIIDNATLNSTLIGEVAYAFMSNETVAYEVFKKLGATHVVVFVTHGSAGGGPQGTIPMLLGYGDESKWVWMLRIANQVGHSFNETEYLDERGRPTDKFWRETLIGQLIPYKPQQMTFNIVGHIYQPPQLRHFRLVYESSPPYQSLAYVYIYEIVD